MSAIDEMEEIAERKAYERGYADGKKEEIENWKTKLGDLYKSCECVPHKEYASDYDKGFHQAMTFARGWIQSLRKEQQQ